ncbi:MAG: HAMP domain-containing sensor histidine kinase [Pseudomonadota bacterium]
MTKARGPNLATKLLLWSCALIVVFVATTAFLLLQVRRDAETASRIVSVNHDLDSAIQRMLERLQGVQDNIRRYRLMGNQEAVRFIVEDLTRFGETLDTTLARHPQYEADWLPLRSAFEIALTPTKAPGDTLAPDATVREWSDTLGHSLLENQIATERALIRLHLSGQRAADIGLYGLIASLALGVGGSLALAWHLNRSLSEVRRGLRGLGHGGEVRDVRVLSGDELGELARAFNAMAARLRREERMRADFVAMLSHEIRTPLTSIREAVDLVGSGTFGEVNERQGRFLDIAEKESVRLTDLLARLMTVSRLESQAMDLSPESTDCTGLVASAMERLAPTARARDITLTADLPDVPVRCLCDPGHVQQVLLNLVGNAIKFSPPGTTVTIGLAAGLPPYPAEVTFRVTDAGPGIPEAEHELVFLKYYREPGMRDSVDGAGLGLAIARRIVEAHGGRMTLESKPGRGSTFGFTLPMDGPLAQSRKESA